MKKIMLIAAAALAGAAFAEDITSNNVVGFQGSNLNRGTSNNRTLVAPQFQNIGKDTIRLGDIKPISTVTTSNRVNLYTLLNTGKTDQQYRWNCTKWIDVKNAGADASDVEIPAGKSLWTICTATADTSLQGSGEVPTEDVVIGLNGGTSNNRTVIGNALPVPIKLSNIVPEAAVAGTTLSNRINVYTLLNTGKTDQQYRWNGTKWVDVKNAGADASNVIVPAGQGLWVICTIAPTTSAVNLRIVNPLAK